MDDAQIVANWLGMTVEQAEELKRRLSLLKENDGIYGYLKIDIKKGQVYKFSHTVDGKPVFYRDDN